MIGNLLYAAAYVLAVMPGLPLGFRLFGRRNAAGWIAGAAIGYALTAFAIWIPIRAGVPSGVAFLCAWLLLSALAWVAFPLKPRPYITLAPWRRSDSVALVFVLLLTSAVALPPLAKVGARDAAGNRYYRAYFTADFVWHTALTSELGKFSMPPRNPYMAPRPIHYYWTYFLLPAAVSSSGPALLRDIERCLRVNAFLTGLLLMSAVFMGVRAAVPHAGAVAASVSLALVASSAEGLYTLIRLAVDGTPLSAVRDLNIDAIAAWPPFQGHRIDGLQRCLWYVPQHSMAYALGLVALAAAAAAGSTAPAGAIALTGVALGCAVAMNPFVGAVFAAAYAIGVAVDAIRRPGPFGRLLVHAIAAVPVLAALSWCVANQMVEGAGGALEFGFSGPSRHSPVLMLLLSLGPAVVPAAAGLWPRGAAPLRPLAPAAALAALSLFLLYFVRLSVDQAWVGFRAGQMMLVSLPALTARLFANTLRRPLAMAAVLVVVLIAGAPTTTIDVYNAQDIANRNMGPGFPWTIVVTPDQQEAFQWIRTHTAPTAIVQMDPISRDRSTWSLIPSFAERRMAAGLPISLLNVPEYRERSDRVRVMYDTPDAAEAWQIARRLRIDYVYVDDVERAAYPNAAKFDGSSQQFERVFAESGVSIYRVR